MWPAHGSGWKVFLLYLTQQLLKSSNLLIQKPGVFVRLYLMKDNLLYTKTNQLSHADWVLNAHRKTAFFIFFGFTVNSYIKDSPTAYQNYPACSCKEVSDQSKIYWKYTKDQEKKMNPIVITNSNFGLWSIWIICSKYTFKSILKCLI